MSGRGRFDTGRQYERLAEQEDAAVLKTAGDFAGSSPAALTHGYPNRQREAVPRCRPVRVQIPLRAPRQGIPTSRGRRLRPGVLQVQILSLVRRARSTTVVRPLDERLTRGSTPPAPTTT